MQQQLSWVWFHVCRWGGQGSSSRVECSSDARWPCWWMRVCASHTHANVLAVPSSLQNESTASMLFESVLSSCWLDKHVLRF